MALSERGSDWAKAGSENKIWSILGNLWDKTSNPDGFISLGLAENALMHDEMTAYLNKVAALPPKGLTYRDGGLGHRDTRQAMAQHINRFFKPLKPVTPDQICMTNGVSSCIELTSFVFCNPGDVYLLGRPHYGAFIRDIQDRSGARVERVAFGDVDPLSVEGIRCYEEAIIRCKANGKTVKAFMLCNPHNPLSRCYSRDALIEIMKLCSRYDLHLVADEIYALSVFRHPSEVDAGGPALQDFISILSLPTEDIIDPSRVHCIYGMSKDFGANGLRVGALISQSNQALHHAMTMTMIQTYASSLAEASVTTMLNDHAWTDAYVAENRKRLRKQFEVVTSWADRRGIHYANGVNAGFFLWADLGKAYQEYHPNGADSSAETIDQLVNEALISSRVLLSPGVFSSSEKPGWFRIVFSQPDLILLEGLRRVDQAIGFASA